MRKFLSPLLLAGAVAALNVLPVGAELDYCLVDPAVTIGHTTVQVGVYTADQTLLTDVTGPIQVTLHGAQGQTLTTDQSAWMQGRYQVSLAVDSDLKDRDAGHQGLSTATDREPFAVDAYVPSANQHQPYFIKVTTPDGHSYFGYGHTNKRNTLRVDVPE